MIYKYCAFIDILGFRQILKDFDRANQIYSELLTVMAQEDLIYKSTAQLRWEEVSKTLQKETGKTAKTMQNIPEIKIMSDAIVISDESWPTVFDAAKNVQAELFKKNILCRGAISFGKHKSEATDAGYAVVSQALSAAYEAESKDAIYPRIILDSACLTAIAREYRAGASWNRMYIRNIIVDSANTYFLPFDFSRHDNPPKFLNEQMKEAKSPSVISKVKWLIEFYDYLGELTSSQQARISPVTYRSFKNFSNGEITYALSNPQRDLFGENGLLRFYHYN